MVQLRDEDLITRGNMAGIYRRGDSEVLKVFDPHVFPGAADAELTATRRAAELGVSVPRALELVEVEGRRGIVYERIDAPLLVDVLTANPTRLWSDARRLAALHREVHERPGDGLPDLLDMVRAGVERVDDSVVPVATRPRILEYLSELPVGAALCHMDYHPGNVFLAPSGWMLFDWTLASRAHPAADVAHSVVAIGEGAPLPHMSRIQRLVTDVFRRTFTRAYLRNYLSGASFDAALVERFKPLAYLLRLVLVANPLERELLSSIVRARFGAPALAARSA